jgi:hypothetical protein
MKIRSRDDYSPDGYKSDKTDFRHSTFYHGYFEGYTETKVPKPNGKGNRITRIYTGEYYRQDLTRRQRVLIRLVYGALYLFALSAFLFSTTRQVASNNTWYVGLPGLLVAIPMLLMLIITIAYITTRRDMKLWDYKSSSINLKKVSLVTSACYGVLALLTVVFIILNPAEEPLSELVCLAGYIAGGLAVLAVNRLENRVKYLKVPNQQKRPEEGVQL